VSGEEETDIRSGGDNADRSASMRLGAERPRVTRLSRKVLAGAAAVGAAAIFGGVPSMIGSLEVKVFYPA
jgi:hypothetical protein